MEMDIRSEERKAHRAATLKAEEIENPEPARKQRQAAIDSRSLTAGVFESGGAFDSQTDSQTYVAAIYDDAGKSMRTKPEQRSERPDELDRDGAGQSKDTKPKQRSESPDKDKLDNRGGDAEEEVVILRARLKETERALKETERDLARAKRSCEQWRDAATKASRSLNKAAQRISDAQDALDIVEEVSA
ncbi:hypothetical protein C8R44DRAFT_383845 [Mycena epipterygia]|nr:hypothetical protein C8R44DRAFT_383845 [Mycena epipterygia]